MSENKNTMETWTTNQRKALNAVINDNSRVDDEFYKVRILSDEFEKIPVYKIKHDILGYNFDNGRIIAEKKFHEQQHKIKLTPTNNDHQKIVGGILYESIFYSATATKDLEDDIKKKGLDEPLIVSIDGTVWNGNRRLSIYRKLCDDKGDQKYEWVNVVVLPELSHKDLKKFERRLQMHREWKQLYGSIQTRLDVRSSMNDKNWKTQEIIASYGNRYSEEKLKEYVQEIDLIDYYLEQINRPNDYAFIKSKEGGRGTGVESFTTLNQILQKANKQKTPIEVEKIKLSGLQIIHHPESTHDNVRNYSAVMSNPDTRNEFEKNSETFKDFNKITKNNTTDAFTNDLITKEWDNLDFAYQTRSNLKKDAKKLANSALKTLEKIDDSKIPKNNTEFKKIISSLDKQISRIRSKSG